MIKPACDLQTFKRGKKSAIGVLANNFVFPEGFRQITSYFPEGFRQITSYLPEGFRKITSSLFHILNKYKFQMQLSNNIYIHW